MSTKKRYELPPGVRYLTEAELDARRADKGLKRAEHKVTREGITLPDVGGAVKRLRRGRRRRGRIPAAIFRRPR